MGHVCDRQRVGRGTPGAAAFFPAGREFIPRFLKFTQLRNKPRTTSQCLVYSVILQFFFINSICYANFTAAASFSFYVFVVNKNTNLFVSEIITYVFFQ